MLDICTVQLGRRQPLYVYSPDKKMSIIVSSPKRGLVSIAQVQQMAPAIYPDDKVTKSSTTEFEMEGKSTSGKPNVYRAVPAGARVCIAEIHL